MNFNTRVWFQTQIFCGGQYENGSTSRGVSLDE